MAGEACYAKAVAAAGAGAFSAVDGSMIYKAWYPASSVANYQKAGAQVGNSPAVMAAAVAQMKAANWGSQSAIRTFSGFTSITVVYAGACRFNVSSLVGTTITKARFTTSGTYAGSYLVKFLGIATAGAPPADWDTCTADPQFTGSGTGDFEVEMSLPITLPYLSAVIARNDWLYDSQYVDLYGTVTLKL